jgi:ABC-type branched-subunit amino acid transport system ATPase component
MQSAIEIDGLRKAYGDVEAVSDISFSVAAGEVFCLLGPNGAGKTTTTEILEGYRARSAGDVRVLGHDPEDGERALRERVGIVLQEAAAQAELTVTEVLTMYGRYYPRRRPARWPSSAIPTCSSSTSRPPASTRRRAARRGRRSRTSARWERPSSSPPTSWTRRRRSPTAWP